jgi:predicted RecB family nuclease
MIRIILPVLFLGICTLISFNSNAQNSNKMYRIAKIKVDGNQLEQYKVALKEQMNTAIKVEPGVLEADLIVRLHDGRWAAIEVKLGNKQIEEAALNLLALKLKIDEEKMGKAAFLMIITGGQNAYQRKDGIWVVPIGRLKD